MEQTVNVVIEKRDKENERKRMNAYVMGIRKMNVEKNNKEDK